MVANIKNFILHNFIDKNLRANYKHYIFQSLLMLVCASLIIWLSRFLGGIVVASIGASCFILFMMPSSKGSCSRRVIGGYVCGITAGLLCNLLYFKLSGLSFDGRDMVLIVVSAAAVSVTAFLMVVTNSEHPPSAALALGLCTDVQGLKTAVAAIISIVALCALRKALRRYLRDLS